MYHQNDGVSSPVVTIQLPHLIIQADWREMRFDTFGGLQPLVRVYTSLPKREIEHRLDRFQRQAQLNVDFLTALVLDLWSETKWTEDVAGYQPEPLTRLFVSEILPLEKWGTK